MFAGIGVTYVLPMILLHKNSSHVVLKTIIKKEKVNFLSHRPTSGEKLNSCINLSQKKSRAFSKVKFEENEK